MDVEILYCPKCGARYREAVQPRGSLDLTKPLTCATCHQSFDVDELRTASGEALPDFVAGKTSAKH